MFKPRHMALLLAAAGTALFVSCKKDLHDNATEKGPYRQALARAYDAPGNRCRVVAFDAAGSTHKETINRFTRTYNAAGKVTALHAAIGFPAPMYTYDVELHYAPHSIYIIENNGDTLMHVPLDIKGRAAGYSSSPGHYYNEAGFVYDAQGRLQTVHRRHTTTPDPGAMAKDTLRYGYDQHGNLSTVAGGADNQYGLSFQYDYDRPVNGGGYYVYFVYGNMAPLVLLEYAGLLGERPRHALAAYQVTHYGSPFDWGMFANHVLDADGNVIAYDNLEWGTQRQSWDCRPGIAR